MSDKPILEQVEAALARLKTEDPDAVVAVEETLAAIGIHVEGDVAGEMKVAGRDLIDMSADIKIAITRKSFSDKLEARLMALAELLEERGTEGWHGDPRPIRIFLSSPGDVGEERTRALEAIKEIGNDPLYKERVRLEVVAWDDPDTYTLLEAAMTPQDAINADLGRPADCDIVIAVFWSRMGTPLALTEENTKPESYRFPNESGLAAEQYYSGTEWEFIDAMLARRQLALRSSTFTAGRKTRISSIKTKKPVIRKLDSTIFSKHFSIHSATSQA